MILAADTALQILVNLGALGLIYTRLEVKLAVIATKVAYIEKRLKIDADIHGMR